MRINIKGIDYELSHPSHAPGRTVWMASPIGRRGQPLKATYAVVEANGAFSLGSRMF